MKKPRAAIALYGICYVSLMLAYILIGLESLEIWSMVLIYLFFGLIMDLVFTLKWAGQTVLTAKTPTVLVARVGIGITWLIFYLFYFIYLIIKARKDIEGAPNKYSKSG